MVKKTQSVKQNGSQKPINKGRIVQLIGVVLFATILSSAAFLLMGERTEEVPAVTEKEVAPVVGATAPEFELVSHHGELVSLSNFRGRPVAVMFMHTW